VVVQPARRATTARSTIHFIGFMLGSIIPSKRIVNP
jgi:hypothetical protein